MIDPIFAIRHWETLKGKRSNFDSLWHTCAEVMFPDAADFFGARSAGERRTQKIFDSTGIQGVERNAAILESLLTPRSREWHRLESAARDLKDDIEVKRWLELVNTTLFDFRQRPRAGYYGSMHECYKQLSTFGNSVLYVDADPRGGMTYRSCPLARVWFETDYAGLPQIVYYTYPITAWAAHQKWGDAVGPKVKACLANEPFREFDVLRCVQPHQDYTPTRVGFYGMRYEAAEIITEERQVVARGGYHEMPYMIGRYTLSSGEIYGRGPGQIALPDVLSLQAMERTHLRSGEKIADPPLLVAEEGVIGTTGREVSLRSGEMSYGAMTLDGKPLVAPLITGARLDITFEMIERKRQIVREIFNWDLFVFLRDHPQMTATEVMEVMKEKAHLVGPVIGRQQTEVLGPQIEREIAVLFRQGQLPEPPPQLLERTDHYRVEYESDATQFQKAADASGVARTLEITQPFWVNNPSFLQRYFKEDEIVAVVSAATGTPARVITSQEERVAIDQAQREVREAETEAAALPEAAKGVRDIAEARQKLGIGAGQRAAA